MVRFLSLIPGETPHGSPGRKRPKGHPAGKQPAAVDAFARIQPLPRASRHNINPETPKEAPETREKVKISACESAYALSGLLEMED